MNTATKTAREICPNCNKPMEDGELVQTNWAGDPIAHIGCQQTEESHDNL